MSSRLSIIRNIVLNETIISGRDADALFAQLTNSKKSLQNIIELEIGNDEEKLQKWGTTEITNVGILNSTYPYEITYRTNYKTPIKFWKNLSNLYDVTIATSWENDLGEAGDYDIISRINNDPLINFN